MDRKIAIIIPVKGKSETLLRCLNSVCELDYPHFEIIVVDDGVDESTQCVLHSMSDKITVINNYSQGPSRARNSAAKHTDAEFIAFTDSDCLVSKNWLQELLNGFKENNSVVAVGGVQYLPADATLFEKKVFTFMHKVGFLTDYMRTLSGKQIFFVNHNASCNVMYRREIFLKEGGFLEKLWPGEDVELDYRLVQKGYQLLCNAQAVVWHYRPKNFDSFFQMMFRYGSVQAFLVKKYGIFRRIQLVPFLSVGLSFLLLLLMFLKLFFPLILVFFICFGGLFVYCNFDVTVVRLVVFGFAGWNIGFGSQYIFAKNNRTIES